MALEILFVIGGVVLGIVLFYAIFGRKKTWYNVSLANPEMSEYKVYRTLYDRLWALDSPSFLLFRKEDGSVIKINKKWIIKIEVA